ncbi:hypothetical protein HK405_009522, partial [Cladochytrium tenue]
GVTLSGGQAARVNLARAVYSDADVLLLDDPLAAVDAHVGRSLLEDCILGLCRSGKASRPPRTVVLVTHQLFVARRADHVLLVDDGEIVAAGAYLDLIDSSPRFAALMDEMSNVSESDDEGTTAAKGGPDQPEHGGASTATDDGRTAEMDGAKPAQLIEEEERLEGGVAFKYYLA